MDKATINKKNRRFTALAWILAILVLAVAVPLNLIFDRLNLTADMTPYAPSMKLDYDAGRPMEAAASLSCS